MTNPTLTDARHPIDEPGPEGMTSEERRGRSAGVVVAAVMGLAWAASALGLLGAAVAVPLLVAGAAIVAVLVTGARRLRRTATAMRPSAPGSDLQKLRRRFAGVAAGECAAILAAINILVRAGETQWIPAVVCAAVGVHFMPLARMFGVRLYYAAAAALLVVAATTMVVGTAGGSAHLMRLLPGFGAALVLWATSARLLVTTRRLVAAQEGSGHDAR